MCCIVSGEPIDDPKKRIKTFHPGAEERVVFQTSMTNAPCIDCPYSCFWFCGQFLPPLMGCTQYAIRKKVLQGDMSKYQCFQGYFTICCCIKGGSCAEESCPDLCAFLEGCFCNCVAVSASRVYTMEKYNLSSDACDYRLIRINNCLQCLSIICDIASIFNRNLRQIACILDYASDIMYHAVSGCMTAQVAYEVSYQEGILPHKVLEHADNPLCSSVSVEAIPMNDRIPIVFEEEYSASSRPWSKDANLQYKHVRN